MVSSVGIDAITFYLAETHIARSAKDSKDKRGAARSLWETDRPVASSRLRPHSKNAGEAARRRRNGVWQQCPDSFYVPAKRSRIRLLAGLSFGGDSTSGRAPFSRFPSTCRSGEDEACLRKVLGPPFAKTAKASRAVARQPLLSFTGTNDTSPAHHPPQACSGSAERRGERGLGFRSGRAATRRASSLPA